MLYRTRVVLLGKLFRIKTCLWPKPISVNLLYTSKSSQLVYSLQPLKVLLLPLTTSRGRIKGEQCSLLCHSGHTTLGWESHESSQHACTPWCAPVPARHVDCIPLQSVWVELSLAAVIKNYFGPSPDQPSWLNLLSTENSNIRNLDKLPREQSLLAGTQLASGETRAWRYQLSIGRLNAQTPTEYSYTNVLSPFEWNIV